MTSLKTLLELLFDLTRQGVYFEECSNLNGTRTTKSGKTQNRTCQITLNTFKKSKVIKSKFSATHMNERTVAEIANHALALRRPERPLRVYQVHGTAAAFKEGLSFPDYNITFSYYTTGEEDVNRIDHCEIYDGPLLVFHSRGQPTQAGILHIVQHVQSGDWFQRFCQATKFKPTPSPVKEPTVGEKYEEAARKIHLTAERLALRGEHYQSQRTSRETFVTQRGRVYHGNSLDIELQHSEWTGKRTRQASELSINYDGTPRFRVVRHYRPPHIEIFDHSPSWITALFAEHAKLYPKKT